MIITREEIQKVNKNRLKGARTKLSEDITNYLETCSSNIRQGRFISNDNIFSTNIRRDTYFQEQVIKALKKEGFNCTVEETTRSAFRPKGRKVDTPEMKVYTLKVDLNV